MASNNTTWSIFDLFSGRSGHTAVDGSGAFSIIFAETSGRTNSGENVNVENALEDATVVSCITAITQGITQVPIHVRRMKDDGSYDIMRNHPVKQLIDRPNEYQTATEFKSAIVTSILVYGNCFIRIIKVNGRPTQLLPMDPSDITVGANEFGAPVYTHDEYDVIPSEEIIHIRDLATFAPQGCSRFLLAAERIGALRAADSLMAETFKNGVSMNYAITSDSALDSATRLQMQESLRDTFGAGGSRRGGVALIEGGSIQALKGATPADADLRELRNELKREVAAVFRVPSYMAGTDGDERYNNVRQKLSSFHRDTLQPLMTNIEEAMSMKLLAPNENIYFDVTDLIKGAVNEQIDVASRAVMAGIWTQNEGRMFLGKNPVDQEGADELIRPNSTSTETETTTTVEDEPTGGEDGPQGGNDNDE